MLTTPSSRNRSAAATIAPMAIRDSRPPVEMRRTPASPNWGHVKPWVIQDGAQFKGNVDMDV